VLKSADRAVATLRRRPEERGVVLEHQGHVDLAELGSRIAAWLEVRSFEAAVSAGGGRCQISAEGPDGLKKTIGASPSLEVEIAAAVNRLTVSVRPGRASGAVWTARFFTYSWLVYGMSFVSLRSALLEFIRGEVEGRDGAGQPRLEVVGMVETMRIEQPMGAEQRVIDNAQSETTITRTLRATKRWTQSCQLEIEKSRVNGQTVDVSVPNVASLRASLEHTLRERYSTSVESEQIFEEEVAVTVPPRSRVELVMEWKRIVQQGYIELQDTDGVTLEVPFEAAVGVTFDQRQIGGG
jgi:hypothetical protein